MLKTIQTVDKGPAQRIVLISQISLNLTPSQEACKKGQNSEWILLQDIFYRLQKPSISKSLVRSLAGKDRSISSRGGI